MYRSIAAAFAGLMLLALPDSTFGQLPNRNSVGQPPAQYRRPTTSPYLNLLDGNNSDAFNYFRRVRPEVDFRRENARLERSIQDLDRRAFAPPPQTPTERIRTISPTGHPTSFRSLSTYFPRRSGGRSGGNSFGRR